MDRNILEQKIADGGSTRSIAHDFNCGQTTIRYWLKKYNLKTDKEKFTKHQYKCICGEARPDEFFGVKKSLCKKCFNVATASNKRKVREEIILLLGGKCRRCGIDNKILLQRHHINKNGNKERKQYSRVIEEKLALEKIKLGSKEYELLCANCHILEHHMLG